MYNKNRKMLFGFIPVYGIWPAALVMIFNTLTFSGTRFFNTNWKHYDFSTIDKYIPFVPFFILFYVAAFFQWAGGGVIIMREKRSRFYRFVAAMIMAEIITATIFMIWPSYMTRADFDVKGPFTLLTRFIYWVDSSDNLFPSLHCIWSWMVYRYSTQLTEVPKWTKWFMLFLSLGIFASVVFVKQHLFLDIVSGVAIAELTYQLAERLPVIKKWAAKYDKLDEVED